MLNVRTTESSILGADVLISKPSITPDMALAKWMKKRGRYWPADLSVDLIKPALVLYYAPTWYIESIKAQLSYTWESSKTVETVTDLGVCKECLGEGRTYTPTYVMQTCPSCKGSGRSIYKTEKTEPDTAEGTDIQTFKHLCTPNVVAPELRTIGKVFKKPRHSQLTETVDVLKPSDAKPEEHITRIMSKKALKGRDGYITGLKILKTTPAKPWLIPVYLGTVDYQGESLHIEVNADSGDVYVDPPLAVRLKREQEEKIIKTLRRVAIFAVVAVVITLIIMWQSTPA